MAGHAIHLLTSSAWAPLLIFGLAAVIARLAGVRKLRLPWVFFSATLCCAILFAAIAYLLTPILFEDAETDIACISTLAMRGFPVYPALDSAARYILLYGPLTYLVHVPLYVVFGKNLFSFKLLGVISFLASMLGLYGICRKYASRRDSMIGLGCAAVVLFRYIGVEFWGRIDPLILALTVLSVWSTLRGSTWLALSANAFVLSAIPNLKLSGVAYLLPLIGLIFFLRGWRIALTTIGLGAVLFPLPFLLPNVSSINYIAILRVAATHGIVPEFLIRNVQYSLLLMLPVLIALLPSKRMQASFAQVTYAILIGCGLLVTSVLGAKSGAGSYHLIPFLVPVLHLYFWLRSDPSSTLDTQFGNFAAAWVVTTLLLSSTHLRSVIHEFRATALGARSVAEVEQTARTLRGHTYQVGIGADFLDPRTRYAYIPTFEGQLYTVSGAAIRDLQFGGVAIPEATIRDLDFCKTESWLIPHGDEPFSAQNSYFETPHPAFDDSFRTAFRKNYHKVTTGVLYDTWSCKE